MLDTFFIHDGISTTIEKGEYRLPAVILSYVIACFASYTTLSLAKVMIYLPKTTKRLLVHFGGAFAMGTGIWAMHFIGMLAYSMPMAMEYNPLITLLSLAIAVAVAYGVLAMIGRKKLSAVNMAAGAVLLGFGIAAMHYTGMEAIRMDADLRYKPGIFFISILIAIAASGTAMWIAFALARYHDKHRYLLKTIAALVMGAAICGMHYTGMAAAVFIPHEPHNHGVPQDFSFLTLIVGGISSIILVTALMPVIGNRMKSLPYAEALYAFPTKLLACSMLMTVATIVWMGSNSFYIHFFLTHDVAKVQKIAELADEIIYLDGIRSQAIRTTITGDAAFDRRYARTLAAGLNKKIEALPDKDLRGVAVSMDDAGNKIAEFDLHYLELINHGKIKEAEQLIHGSEYNAVSARHMDGKRTLSERVRQASQENILRLENNIYTTLLLVLSAVIILVITWYLALKSINRWRNELQMARETSAKAQKRAETEARTVTLLRSIAATANKAVDVEQTIATLLRLIGEFIDWPVGHAYVLDKEANLARPTNIWFLKDAVNLRKFVEVTMSTVLGRGVGLPGRTWETMQPIWINNVAADDNFPRIKRCPSSGLKAGFAFPVIVNGVLTYILEFFTTEVLDLSEEIQTIMQEAVDQLVLVIERVQIQQALEEARSLAEAANAAKSEFLANMSHELRTPLNSMLGMLRLLKESNLSQEQSELVGTAAASSNSLLEIVNDILDLSKIEANEVELERIGFDLQYVFHSVIITLDHIAREKRVSLKSNYTEVAFPIVLGDPTRFGRVLVNLMSNAIKYTEQGHVNVHIRLEPSDRGQNFIGLYCAIKDTGIGIAKEKQKAIFDKFVQADTSTTRKYGGTGLGLAITKQLVELMEGQIGVESEPGHGSTFWFKIPFEITDTLTQLKGHHRTRERVGIISPEKARILVAEDHPMNQVYIKKLLKKFGIDHFELVGNGVDAIKRYNTEKWDIILMDCHMPEKNGYDATIDIRSLERKQATAIPIPIIAMTANAMVGDREKCLRCGMDDYVSKPIDIDELKEVLGQWIRFPIESSPIIEKPAISQESMTVDLSQLRIISDGNPDAEHELIQLFLEQSEANMKSLEESSAVEEKAQMWKEAAHMFKGGAAGLGAEPLRILCNKAQHLEPTDVKGRQILFKQIGDEYLKVKQYLKDQQLID